MATEVTPADATSDAAARSAPSPARRRGWREWLGNRELIVLALIVLTGAVAASLSPYFLTYLNLKNVLIASSVEIIVAVGLALVLIAGGIDLSVGSVMGVAAIAMALVFDAGGGVPVAVAAALGVGLVAGTINGGLIAYAGLNPLITTLGTMSIARSFVFILSGGYALSAIPAGFKATFNGEALLGMPNLVWLSLALAALFHVLHRRHAWFRGFTFLGGNETAALRAGLPVARRKAWVYVISGLLASLAAIVTVARMGSAFPNTGTGLELRVITAVVVGGCSIYGGRGTVLGAALGVVFLNLVANALVLLGMSVYWQGVAAGTILILAILTDATGRKGAR